MTLNTPAVRYSVAAVASVTLPLIANWQLFYFAAPLSLAFVIVYVIEDQRRLARQRVIHRLRDRICVTCGYDLRCNVSGVCPECGADAPRRAWPELAHVEVAKPDPRRDQIEIRPIVAFFIIGTAAIALTVMCWVTTAQYSLRGRQVRLVAAQADVSALSGALEEFRADTGRYPTTAEGLSVLAPSTTAEIRGWKGPYVRLVPSDPWGTPYVYVCPGMKNPNGFDLTSAGPDGKLGTADDVEAR